MIPNGRNGFIQRNEKTPEKVTMWENTSFMLFKFL